MFAPIARTGLELMLAGPPCVQPRPRGLGTQPAHQLIHSPATPAIAPTDQHLVHGGRTVAAMKALMQFFDQPRELLAIAPMCTDRWCAPSIAATGGYASQRAQPADLVLAAVRLDELKSYRLVFSKNRCACFNRSGSPSRCARGFSSALRRLLQPVVS